MDRKVPGIVVFITVLLVVCLTLTAMGGIYLSRLKTVAEQLITEEMIVEGLVVEETAVPPPMAVEPAEQPALEEPVVAEPVAEEVPEEGISLEGVMSGLPELADKLETCESFTQTFIHPMMGGEMERRVIGMDGSDCIYQETMPNNGLMECRYPEELRKSAAQYYRAIAQAEVIHSEAELSLDGESDVTTTVDGEVIEDPLQEAMSSGLCTISGY